MGPCHAPKASQNNNSICRIRVGRMNQLERDELKDKLDDFSRRLDAQVRNWKERGEFTDTVRRLIDDIRRRRDQIEKKLALAEAKGTPWDVIKIETERDFSSIFDDLLQIGERLDSEEIKARRQSC